MIKPLSLIKPSNIHSASKVCKFAQVIVIAALEELKPAEHCD
jgi:hypothetical protein